MSILCIYILIYNTYHATMKVNKNLTPIKKNARSRLVTVLRTDHRYAAMSNDSSLVSYNAIMHHYLQLIPSGMLQCRHIFSGVVANK